MSDYMNYKWRNFLRTDGQIREQHKKILREERDRKSKSIKADTQTKTLTLPTPKISEKWGKPGTVERKEVEGLLRRIAPREKGFVNKINKINSFVNNCKGDNISVCRAYAVSTILSRLMTIEILTSIIYDFNSSTGGFLFEAFMAAVLGKKAEQIEATQKRGSGERGDIADILDEDGNPLSLKFFKEGGSKEIKGSIEDLRASIEKYGMPIPYLVAIKKQGAGKDVADIEFYQFTIGATEGVPEGMGGDINIDSPRPDGGSYTKGPQFQIPVTYLTGKKVKQIDPITTLNFGSAEEMTQIANNYADQLGDDVTSIYNYLDSLSKNINNYLIRNSAKSGNQAVTDAKSLAKSAKKIAPTK